MALARVVSFEDVDPARLDALRSDIEQGERPDDVPASEMLMLHDPDGRKALAILLFESEDDYRKADEALDRMPADETPGRRSTVSRYDVKLRMKM